MSKITKETQKKMFKLYKSLKIEDLRKRQDLCSEQLSRAYDQKNDDAVFNLYVMSGLLTAAIIFVEFGENTEDGIFVEFVEGVEK